MASFRSDPLLGISRGLLTFIMGSAILIGAALFCAIPALLWQREQVVAELANKVGQSDPGALIGAIVLTMGLVLIMLGLGWKFISNLRAIVDTVATGDPFTPLNAARLRAMGWISIALQVVALMAGMVTLWVEEATKSLEAKIDLSIGGILLPLVLFILARVFRRGAEMREELEGTV